MLKSSVALKVQDDETHQCFRGVSLQQTNRASVCLSTAKAQSREVSIDQHVNSKEFAIREGYLIHSAIYGFYSRVQNAPCRPTNLSVLFS